MPITFAHRGARLLAPENTIEAFRIGLDLGASGLESDVHLSADGVPVLIHDAVFRRGVRRRRVSSTSTAELASVDVPGLADLYETLGGAFELSLDLKASGTGEAVLEVAAAAGATQQLWMCADLETLWALRDARDLGGAHLVHSTRRRTIAGSLERHAADLAEGGIDAVNFHRSDWSPGLVALYHRFGVLAFAWDVQEERHLRQIVAAGVDGVYSDRVQSMVEVVAELEPGPAPGD